MPAPHVKDDQERAYDNLRTVIKTAAEAVKWELIEVKGHRGGLPLERYESHGEEIANLTLAFRHLEDANMRIGKAIQAHNGGVSVYDQSTAVMG